MGEPIGVPSGPSVLTVRSRLRRLCMHGCEMGGLVYSVGERGDSKSPQFEKQAWTSWQ